MVFNIRWSEATSVTTYETLPFKIQTTIAWGVGASICPVFLLYGHFLNVANE